MLKSQLLRRELGRLNPNAYSHRSEELKTMKIVLYRGRRRTRIHEYSETIYRDFVLFLGYKYNITNDFLLNYRPYAFSDCAVSEFSSQIELLGEPQEDWRVSIIDTWLRRNISEGLWVVHEQLHNEECFLDNYGDVALEERLQHQDNILISDLSSMAQPSRAQ
jgi:hypothetical protein